MAGAAVLHRALHRSDRTDERSRASLDWLLERRRDGPYNDWQVVLLDSTLGPMVVDGNKRAAAIHKASEADAAVPAFLLSSIEGERLPLPP